MVRGLARWFSSICSVLLPFQPQIRNWFCAIKFKNTLLDYAQNSRGWLKDFISICSAKQSFPNSKAKNNLIFFQTIL